MIRAEKLNFSYAKKKILHDVDFYAGKAEIVSLLGPNGSGKSTLLRCLSGILPIRRGKLYISGKPIKNYSRRELAKIIAFLPQIREKINSLTVYELITMGRSPYSSGWSYSQADREAVNWAIEYMQLEAFTDLPVDKLSGGEMQRVWIAVTLAQDTPIILLDEPVTFMDLRHQYDLLKVLRDLRDIYGKTVITVFHDINHALEISDRVYLLSEGRIFESGLADKVITATNIQDVFRVRAEVRPISDDRSILIPYAAQSDK